MIEDDETPILQFMEYQMEGNNAFLREILEGNNDSIDGWFSSLKEELSSSM